MPRATLSRDRVLRAAVALADEAGIEAPSMRRLAQDLGVVPMALYKHVSGKDDLLDGMIDVVVGEIEPADTGAAWKPAVRGRILAARRTMLRHPWASRAIESRPAPTPAVLAYLDSVIGLFHAGGLSTDLTHHVMHALGSRVLGFTQELYTRPAPTDPAPADPAPASAEANPAAPPARANAAAAATRADPVAAPARANPAAASARANPAAAPAPDDPVDAARAMAAAYPHVARIALAAAHDDGSIVGSGCDDQFEFEFALDLLLDGFERLHAAQWTSAR